MKCEEVMDLMQRYVDHDLDELETFELMDHIAECLDCAEKFQILQALSRDLEDLPAVTPKYSLVEAILPQLDAIDEARREQGSALQEMKPVTLQGGPDPRQKSKPIPWWNKVAGRAALGVAAAAAVLGVVAVTYEPQVVENADMSLMQENSEPAANTHNASGGGGETADPEQAESSTEGSSEVQPPEDSLTSSGTPVTEDSTTDSESAQQPDNTGDDAPVHSAPQKEEQPAPAERSTDKQAEPEKEPAASGTGAAEEAPSESASEKTAQAEEAPKAEQAPRAADSQTDQQEPEVETFTAPAQENGGSADDKSQATTAPGSEKDAETDSTAPEQGQESSPDSDELKESRIQNGDTGTASSMGIAAQPETNDMFSLKSAERPANESPDGQYIVEVEGKKLTVYQKSEDGSEKIAMEVRTLNGTWVGGNWSEDSKTFTYSTEQDGTVSNYIYTVPQISE